MESKKHHRDSLNCFYWILIWTIIWCRCLIASYEWSKLIYRWPKTIKHSSTWAITKYLLRYVSFLQQEQFFWKFSPQSDSYRVPRFITSMNSVPFHLYSFIGFAATTNVSIYCLIGLSFNLIFISLKITYRICLEIHFTTISEVSNTLLM